MKALARPAEARLRIGSGKVVVVDETLGFRILITAAFRLDRTNVR